MAHDIDPVGYPHRNRELLLDQQDRHPAPGNFRDQVADLLNDDRCQPLGRFVDHDQFRVTHQRAANRQHLLFAARHHAGGGIGPCGEIGKHLEHVFEPPLAGTPGILDAQHQVLPHCQAGKNIAMLRHVA